MPDQDIDWYSPDLATFGDRLAGARDALGMSQRDLAHRLGVRVETLQGWEDDRTEPRANRLRMLSGLLNVSMRWLMTGEGQGPETTQPTEADAVALLTEMRDLRIQVSRASERLALLEKRLRRLLEQPA